MDIRNVNAVLRCMPIYVKDLHYKLKEFDKEFKQHLNLNPFKKHGLSNLFGVVFPFINKVNRKNYYYLYNDLKPSIDYVLNNENFLRIIKIIEREDFKDHSLNHLTKYIQHILNIVVVHNSYIQVSSNPYSKSPKSNYYNNWMANDKLDWMITGLFDFMRSLLYYIMETKNIKEEHFKEFIENINKHKTMKYFCKPSWVIRLTHNNYITLFRRKDLAIMFARYYTHVKYKLEQEHRYTDVNLGYRHYLQAFVFEDLDKDSHLYNPRRITTEELGLLSKERGDDSCYKFMNYCYGNKFLPSMLTGAYCHHLYELFLYFNKEV